MTDAALRLTDFLNKKSETAKFQQLTPDASTREYFRIDWQGKTAIACVYPEAFVAEEQNYLDVTRLFLESGLPVAEIYDFEGKSGIIILEDFGDTILRDVLERSDFETREKLLNQAISLIVRIQSATARAFESNSIASRLKFDEEKLLWELNFFKTHYFESLKKMNLARLVEENLQNEFSALSGELERRAKVLCHRDFHAANVMVGADDRLRIIDHQDARIGSLAYDPVSLLLDRVLRMPEKNWLEEKKLFFLSEREKLGLEIISLDEFNYEFDLMTVQRCLKAIGTFSNQTANFGKTAYIQYIEPMFEIVLQALERLDKFPVLRETIAKELKKN